MKLCMQSLNIHHQFKIFFLSFDFKLRELMIKMRGPLKIHSYF